MFEHFAAGARTAVTAALEEARHRGDRRLGTEHLLLGVLHARELDPLGELGLDLPRARAALAALDVAALAAVGMDTVTGQLRLTFGIEELMRGFDFLIAVIGLFGIG